MTIFQLLLFILAGGILYLFFKQLFSGNHPKRGIDFEAKVAEERIWLTRLWKEKTMKRLTKP